MTTPRLLLLIFLVILSAAFVIFLYRFIRDPSLISLLLAMISPLLIAAILDTSEPISETLDSFLNRGKKLSSCTIYLYGMAGSGKTSLMKSWLQADQKPEKSTEVFDYYPHQVLDSVEQQKYIKINIADYQGQKQSGIINNEKLRLANAILFVVDVVPRYDESYNLLDTSNKQIEWLSHSTAKKIHQRVDDHRIYIMGSLEPLFDRLFNKHLYSIRLVINKYDLIEKLGKKGLLPDLDSDADSNQIQKYAIGLFKDIETEIRRACQVNQIQDFSVSLISTSTDLNVRNLLRGIIKTYKNKQN